MPRRCDTFLLTVLAGALIPRLLLAQAPPAEKPAAKAEVKAEASPYTGRSDRSDQGRGAEPLAGHGDAELPDRRDRPAAHRISGPEAGQ